MSGILTLFSMIVVFFVLMSFNFLFHYQGKPIDEERDSFIIKFKTKLDNFTRLRSQTPTLPEPISDESSILPTVA